MAEYPSLLYLIQLDYEHSDSRDTQHGLLTFLVLTDTNQNFRKLNLGLESTSRIYFKRVFFPHSIVCTFVLHMQWVSILGIKYFIYIYIGIAVDIDIDVQICKSLNLHQLHQNFWACA